MKLKEYKGYEIIIDEFDGTFGISGESGNFSTFKATTDKIDTIIKGEVQGIFPMRVIDRNFCRGKITSYNIETGDVIFINDDGKRNKKELLSRYNSDPHSFFVETPENIKLVKEYEEIKIKIDLLRKEADRLKMGSPITEESFKKKDENVKDRRSVKMSKINDSILSSALGEWKSKGFSISDTGDTALILELNGKEVTRFNRFKTTYEEIRTACATAWSNRGSNGAK